MRGSSSATRTSAPTRAKVGDAATVEQFEPGQRVKVTGRRRGQGLPGHDQARLQPRAPSRGSHNVRAPGSIGASADPARVFKGVRMPGRMGGKRTTQRRLEVVEIDAERNLLMPRRVPGPKNGTSRCGPMAEARSRPRRSASRRSPTCRRAVLRELPRVARPRRRARRGERGPARHRFHPRPAARSR